MFSFFFFFWTEQGRSLCMLQSSTGHSLMSGSILKLNNWCAQMNIWVKDRWRSQAWDSIIWKLFSSCEHVTLYDGINDKSLHSSWFQPPVNVRPNTGLTSIIVAIPLSVNTLSIMWSNCAFIPCLMFPRMCRWRKRAAAPGRRPPALWQRQRGRWRAACWKWIWTATRQHWKKYWPGCWRQRTPSRFRTRCRTMWRKSKSSFTHTR